MLARFSPICALFLLVSVVDAANYTCDTSVDELESIAETAIAALQKQGYEILKGKLWWINFDAFGNNPSGSYACYNFYELPDLPPIGPFIPNISDPVFSMKPRDAVVYLGCTPPPLVYFSHCSYVYIRLDPGQYPFAALGDPLNIDTLNHTGNSSDPFGKTMLIVHTPNNSTNRDVAHAFVEAGEGLLDNAVNLDVIPIEWAKLNFNNGTNNTGDFLQIIQRVTLWEDSDQMSEYFQMNFPIFLIRAPLSVPSDPFSTPPTRPRGTGVTEFYLNNTMTLLIDNIVKNFTLKGYILLGQLPLAWKDLDGYRCLSDPSYYPLHSPLPSCVGGDNDAAYYYSSDTPYYLGATEIYVIVGVNHPIAGKNLSYSNFAVDASRGNAGLAAVSNTKYGESAKIYAPSLPNVDLLFAFSVARNCSTESYCLPVSTDDLPLEEWFYFTERVYLEAQTMTGPDHAELLSSIVLKFVKL